MAKKTDEPWQPMLLNVGGAGKPLETRVEYDGVRRRPAKADADDPDWWKRTGAAAKPPLGPTTVATVWASHWRAQLSDVDWFQRLPAGERQLLERAVRTVEIRSGVLEGSVAFGRERPHRVQLKWNPFTHAEWMRVVRTALDASGEATLRMTLSKGEIPASVIDALDLTKLRLFPRNLRMLAGTCTCGGAQLPCDHAAALHLAVARRIERDPWALLVFKGATKDELLQAAERLAQGDVDHAPVVASPGNDVDPFAFSSEIQPDWKSLEGTGDARQALPSPEAWLAEESLDALTRRLVTTALSRGG